MITYDPAVIQKVAARLYAEASRIVVTTTMLGAAVGFLLGGYVGLAFDYVPLPAAIGALLLGLIGYVVGQTRALDYRFRAQLALCQARIEENTRRP